MSRYYKGPASDHFDGKRFFNPDHPSTDRSILQLLRWRFGPRPARWPSDVPVQPVKPDRTVAGCRATMVGHATVLLQVGGLNILTDPLWSERASPFSFMGPRRVAAPGIAFDDLPPIDLVLISHNHYDHLDGGTLARLHARDRPRIVTPLGNDIILRRFIPDAEITAGDWGDSVAVKGGGTVHLVPARHWSARGPGDRREALWCGFVLKVVDATIYFAGDTGYGDGAIFREIRRLHGAPDLALIPIGAYEPRWFMADQHCDPEEAVKILIDLDARRAMGLHWGVIQLTGEPRDEPADHLRRVLAESGIDPARMIAAAPGDVVEV
ncbi:membrane protein [Agaricicola taiwanensis]|uniref:Membrane protein n=1 Tax=Agaricicola taiwanensis TaxID=591372 RepID=A0A8J2YMB5_9RHOB|nr:MBL fold metallo-hydrolase [Agaricicola taiwanensis]GGE51931.1 membrane protein [Agaricicola taiwanensis]